MSDLYKKGMEVLFKVDPSVADTVENKLSKIFPDMARLTVEFGYGEVMSRPGLDLHIRELLNIAILGAMGNAAQLEIHIRGALNTGATKEQVMELILQLAVYAGFPLAFNVLMAALKVFEEK